MQGRVFGLPGLMYSGFLPLGMAIFGPMADYVSLPLMMIGQGAAPLIMGAFVGASKGMRGK